MNLTFDLQGFGTTAVEAAYVCGVEDAIEALGLIWDYVEHGDSVLTVMNVRPASADDPILDGQHHSIDRDNHNYDEYHS